MKSWGYDQFLQRFVSHRVDSAVQVAAPWCLVCGRSWAGFEGIHQCLFLKKWARSGCTVITFSLGRELVLVILVCTAPWAQEPTFSWQTPGKDRGTLLASPQPQTFLLLNEPFLIPQTRHPLSPSFHPPFALPAAPGRHKG